MSNTKTYYQDPATFLPTAIVGSAQSPADRNASFYTNLLAAMNALDARGYEILDTTGTSLAVDVYESQLNVSGTMAFTLPNGTYKGQRKLVRCVGAASTPAATLTVTTPETASGFACQSTFFFDTVGQAVEFVWTENSKWRALRVFRSGGTANNVVVGTTVLSSNPLWATFYCSVTGTVSSTTTKGIPNGSAIGEQILVSCSTAASIPSGTISITARTLLGAASTTLGTFGATTNLMALTWDGTAWNQTGASVTLALS